MDADSRAGERRARRALSGKGSQVEAGGVCSGLDCRPGGLPPAASRQVATAVRRGDVVAPARPAPGRRHPAGRPVPPADASARRRRNSRAAAIVRLGS